MLKIIINLFVYFIMIDSNHTFMNKGEINNIYYFN